MSSILTQSFPTIQSRIPGGIQGVYVAGFGNVSSPNIVNGGLASTGSFFTSGSGECFRYYNQVKYTANFTDVATVNVSNNSKYFEQDVTLNLYTLSQNTRNEFNILAGNSVTIIVQDDNSNYWLLGSSKGLDLQGGKAESGKAAGDMNGYVLQFKGAELYPHVAVTASFLAGLQVPY